MENRFDTATAAPRHQREDGWTPAVQLGFVETLARTGSVERSCAAVGRGVAGAYRLRARPDAVVFRRAWAAALDQAYHHLREVALERIATGAEVPVFYRGQEVYRKTVHNDRLLMFMLNHLKPDPEPAALASSYRVPDAAPVYALAHAALAEAVETGGEPTMPEPAACRRRR